jgi:hypothetical protein
MTYELRIQNEYLLKIRKELPWLYLPFKTLKITQKSTEQHITVFIQIPHNFFKCLHQKNWVYIIFKTLILTELNAMHVNIQEAVTDRATLFMQAISLMQEAAIIHCP